MKNTVFYDISESECAYREWIQADDSTDYSQHIKNCLQIAILEELTEKQRNFFLKYHMDGWTIYEIADEYGVNPSTVSRILKTASKNIGRVMRYSSPRLLHKSIIDKNRRLK